jgi:hypothetical protein
MVFDKDKDYVFSLEKYREACAKDGIPMNPEMQRVDGARVTINDDRTQGLIYVSIHTPVNFNGQVMIQKGEPQAFLMREDWVKEK